EHALALEPEQLLSRRQLAPADRELAVEREQPRRRAVACPGAQIVLVLLARPPVAARAEPPHHAPAAAARAGLAAQIRQRRPELRRQRADGQLHAPSVPVA